MSVAFGCCSLGNTLFLWKIEIVLHLLKHNNFSAVADVVLLDVFNDAPSPNNHYL